MLQETRHDILLRVGRQLVGRRREVVLPRGPAHGGRRRAKVPPDAIRTGKRSTRVQSKNPRENLTTIHQSKYTAQPTFLDLY